MVSWNFINIYETDEKKFMDRAMSVINAQDVRLVVSPDEISTTRLVSDKLGQVLYPDGSYAGIGSEYKHVLIGGSIKSIKTEYTKKKQELYNKQIVRFFKYIEHVYGS